MFQHTHSIFHCLQSNRFRWFVCSHCRVPLLATMVDRDVLLFHQINRILSFRPCLPCTYSRRSGANDHDLRNDFTITIWSHSHFWIRQPAFNKRDLSWLRFRSEVKSRPKPAFHNNRILNCQRCKLTDFRSYLSELKTNLFPYAQFVGFSTRDAIATNLSHATVAFGKPRVRFLNFHLNHD